MEKIGQYFENINNNDYHGDKEFFSSSQLKNAVNDHANFRYYLENGKDQSEWKIDNALDFGTLIHAVLLEPHTLKTDFAFMDAIGLDMRKKADREFRDDFLLQNKGKTILSASALGKASIIKNNVFNHPFAKQLLEAKGKPELSGYFLDTDHNLKMRIRPDRLIELYGNTAIVDIKTTALIDINEFKKKSLYAPLYYDLSAAMYLKGHKLITGEEITDFYFLAIENIAPYRVAVYKASMKYLEGGMKKYDMACANVNIALNNPINEIKYQDSDFQLI